MTVKAGFTHEMTISEKRQAAAHLGKLFQCYGNGKLKDYYNPETGVFYKYAQFNTVAHRCCPFASIGCAEICYACTGCHVFASVKNLRNLQFAATLAPDFSARLIYTIGVELTSRRYAKNHMMLRIHESGDFYSLEYLRKWIAAFREFAGRNITFCFYTKSFKFFLQLNREELDVVRQGLETGSIAMSLSLDDTTTHKQLARAMKLRALLPLVNIYYCTENIDAVPHDHVCDCENCAKCGHCTRTTGKTVVVKIHSATEKKLEKYRRDSMRVNGRAAA